jgi:hypothetical protein
MLGDLLIGGVLILGAAIWRALNIKRKAPSEKHSIAEYAAAFFFPEDDHDKDRGLLAV